MILPSGRMASMISMDDSFLEYGFIAIALILLGYWVIFSKESWRIGISVKAKK